jgi:hypothetical protein
VGDGSAQKKTKKGWLWAKLAVQMWELEQPTPSTLYIDA